MTRKTLIIIAAIIILIGILIIAFLNFYEKKSKMRGKEKSHRRLTSKQIEKESAKRKAKIKSTLDWMEVQEIHPDGILLKAGSKTKYVKGVVITPLNIHLLQDTDKQRAITKLSNVLSSFKFPVYWKFIQDEPSVDVQMNRYIKMIEEEENAAIRKLGEIQIEKLEWFKTSTREVKFYALIQSDLDHLDKMYSQLYRGLMNVFDIKEMTSSDYASMISQEFENDIVNEYIFSQLLRPGVLINEEEEEDEKNG